MRRVGFILDPAPLAQVPVNPDASQEGVPQADAVDDNTEPAAVPDTEADKKPAARKSRRKADEG